MSWFRKYQEDADWHRWYRREFDYRIGRALDDPEDAYGESIERLLVHKLPAYEPRHEENLDALVRTAYRHIMGDLWRKHFGRPRPPREMARALPAAEALYFKFCLERKPVDVIAEELALPERAVGTWATWLRVNDKCPKKKSFRSLDDPDAASARREIEVVTAEDPVNRSAERDQAAAIVAMLLETAGREPSNKGGEALQRTLRAVREELALDDEERLLLKLRFIEELDVTEAATLLGVDRRTVKSRESQVLERLRTLFESHDIGY